MTEFRADATGKAFRVHTELLTYRVPYFRAVYMEPDGHPTSEQLTHPDLDEVAFSLFVRWLYGGLGYLNGPHDFHSMQV